MVFDHVDRIDRDAIAKAVGAGVGVPQKYDLTRGVIGYDESAPAYSFDLDKAKALFAESGAASGLPIDLVVEKTGLAGRDVALNFY